MMNEESIFAAAVRMASLEQRSAYLDEVCRDDSELRRRVESLLAAHENPDSILQSPADSGFVATVDHAQQCAAQQVGTDIGNYKILQQIGEGGFGEVFMAEQQQPVRRIVALKIIKPGMDSRQVIARFEAERQALAMMDHSNIARVLDGGTTENGRPYFVMELVKGVPITEYCDQNQLPADQRLRLFVTVCQAVQHAHQKGIIHRDLKPSNVMVTLHDGQPVVKVIDFGVSKAINQRLTEKTLFTAYGQMVGTPQYMSPEQAEMSGLDVDTRSDIYSLGVLLYELLTGSTPLEAERLHSAGYMEMQRVIREEEPPKPSTRLSTLGDRLSIIAKKRSATPERLHKLVRGDLDWIVMKALEKERIRRYETANGFAADVWRFLNDEPVEARPPSRLYRAGKAVRRNKVLTLAVTLVAVGLMVAILGTTTGWFVAKRARNVLESQNAELLETKDRLSDLVTNYRNELFYNALVATLAGDEQADQLIAQAEQAGITEARRQMLRGHVAKMRGNWGNAIACFQRAADLEDSVAARSSLAVAYVQAGYQEEYGELVSHLDTRMATTPEDFLSLGHAQIFAQPERAIATTRQAIEMRNSVFAHAVLAEAYGHHGVGTDDIEAARQAVRQIEGAAVVAPDKPFISGARLWINVVALQLHDRRGIKNQTLRNQAKVAASDLAKFESYPMGRQLRALYFDYTGDERAAAEEAEASVRHGGTGWMRVNCAALLYITGEYQKALGVLREQANEWTFSLTTLGEVLALEPATREQALEVYEELRRRPRPNWVSTRTLWTLRESILLIAGEVELAQDRCVERLEAKDYVAPWERARLEFVCGKISAEELVREVAPSQQQISAAHKLIAIKCFAEGEIQSTTNHFQAAREACWSWPQAFWSAAYLARMEREPEWTTRIQAK